MSWIIPCRSLRGSVDWNYNRRINRCKGRMSLPSWECGLKFLMLVLLLVCLQCRSLRGSVDWNYLCRFDKAEENPSLPSWECGLKLYTHSTDYLSLCRSLRGSVDWNYKDDRTSCRGFWSLPSWECGLKFLYKFFVLFCIFVAPFVGVWIEISFWRFSLVNSSGRSLRGSVDWNFWHISQTAIHNCRSLRGSVDWNS